MNVRLLFAVLAISALISIPAPAEELDEIVSKPGVGKSFDTSHTATEGQIVDVEGMSRSQFPPSGQGFPIAIAIPTDLVIRLQATRASADWDTHRHGPVNCGVIEDPVADELKDGWPRWKCNTGHFYPGDEADKGTSVLWRAPSQEGCYPGVWMKLFEDDVEHASEPKRDDGGVENEYGILQDQVLLRAVQLVTLNIRNDEWLMVTHATPGPNARDILGLWTYEDENWSWLLDNTMNENGQYLRTDYDGAGVYFGNHLLAVGSKLKTEIVASIRWDEQTLSDNVLPANIVAALSQPSHWAFVQDKKGGWYVNGQADWPDYWPDWVPDDTNPIHESAPDMACNFVPGEKRGWLYFGDAPGPTCYDSQDTTPVGTVDECKMDLRTGVEFLFNGIYNDVHVKDEWGVYVCLVKYAVPPGWVVTVPAMPKPPGAW